jgi:hypothetical protein
VFGRDRDVMIREAGCHERVRSPEMLLRPCARFREREMLP